MVASLNDILEEGLKIRNLTPERSLTKTVWQTSRAMRGTALTWREWLWVCDVYNDYVEVYDGYIPSQDYPRYRTLSFRAAEPDFIEQVFQAIDKALEKRRYDA